MFKVEIKILDVPAGVLLRAGYSANADIIVRRVDAVLALPERVLVFRNDSIFVRLPPVDVDGEPREQAVAIGMSDGLVGEVVGGLGSALPALALIRVEEVGVPDSGRDSACIGY